MRRNSVLIEIILCVLLFALASVIILQLISTAGQINLKSRDEANAIVAMQDAIECLKASPDRLEALSEETSTIYFDREFQPCPSAQAERFIEIAVDKESRQAGDLYNIVVTSFAASSDLIAEFKTAVYVAR